MISTSTALVIGVNSIFNIGIAASCINQTCESDLALFQLRNDSALALELNSGLNTEITKSILVSNHFDDNLLNQDVNLFNSILTSKLTSEQVSLDGDFIKSLNSVRQKIKRKDPRNPRF